MYPKELKYTKDHEWVRLEGDTVTVGITDHAAEQLGDVTYVELPEVGSRVTRHGEAATVESVKAASDVFAPVAGKVAEINGDLDATPELVNESPYDRGWFFKLTDVNPEELSGLMDVAAYEELVKQEQDQ